MRNIKTGTKQWENKHEIFTEQIKDMYIPGNEPALDALDSYNDATVGLQNILKEAVNNNTALRLLGAGWSWTKIATVHDGIMIDTKQLNTTLDISAKSIVPAYKGDVKKLLFAQCGNGVWELSKQLREKNLSLKTTGASNGQTIVGAMSTGAHGSSLDVGAVQDYVLGMHIIVGPNRHVWLERKSAPVVSASFINALQTEIIKDDDLFNAALVSFGSFGIIHGVLIETDDLFLLETYLRRMPYDAKLKKLMSTLDFNKSALPNGSERPFHFSVTINPYDLKNGAIVQSFYKRPYQENYKRASPNAAGIGPGDDAPCFIGMLTNAVPALVPLIVNKLIGGAFKPFEKKIGTLGEIFNNTTLHGKLLSAAIGLPLDQVTRVTDILLEINKTNGPFAGVFAYRFIKKTKATLGFTKFDFTCILELDGAFSDTTKNFYHALWTRLDLEKIPFTSHWGKMNELDIDRLTRMYGPNINAWIAARNKLLDPASMKVFTNPILQQWGLNKVI